jgi:hypothetical protein
MYSINQSTGDMKKIVNKKILKTILFLVFGATLFSACDESDNGAAPIIERVSLVAKDSTTNAGGRGSVLVIFGKNLSTVQEVYFSGVPAPLNTTMVRNDNIIIRIPDSAPFPGPNVLSTVRVITKYGEAQMDFEIAQPDPDIQTFAPAVASAGEEVTIKGEFFNGLQSVSFVDVATGEALEAEIVSYTYLEEEELEQIVVIVPDNVKVSNIAITTAAGTSLSKNTFGFNYAVFTDDVAPGWNKGGWSGTTIWNNSEPVMSGNFSAKHSYTGGWGGFQISHSTAEGSRFLLDDYVSVKVSIFGGPGTDGKLVQIYIKQQVDGEFPAKELAIKEGVWTDYTVSLAELGNPGYVGELVVQDKGMAPYLIFVDDLGFL